MANEIPKQLLQNLSELIAPLVGLNFPETRLGDLERGIVSAAAEFGFSDAEAFARWLVSTPLTKQHIKMLASHLTVGETYFFRDKESFQAMEEHILPALINSRQGGEKRLRIWSAGCSTGEEPYSIAMLVNKLIPNLTDWNITIVATDLNLNSLKKASEGLYSEWSFRDVPSWIKERYFKKTTDGHYRITPAIKKMVAFEYLNLAEDVYPSLLNNTNAMDVIFCRNVLMYFSDERAKKVILGLYNSLMKDGWLFVSPAETFRFISSRFVTVNFSGATIYKKGSKKPQTTENIGYAGVPPYTMHVEPEVVLPRSVEYVPEPQGVSVSADSASTGNAEKSKTQEMPTDPYAEAVTMFEHGRYAEAMEKLDGYLASGNGDAKTLSLLARVCANQGRLGDAMTWCKKAIAADALNPAHHFLLATILMECGQMEDSIQALKKVLYLDQNFVLAYFVMGNLMQQRGEPEVSRRYLRNAFELASARKPEESLPESEGITAGRLSEIIGAMIQ